MLAQLYPPSDNDACLHPKEVAQRISARFPNTVVDWDLANNKLQAELERLEQVGTPEPILTGHKNMFNNTAYIEVHLPNCSSCGVCFLAYLDSAINVESIRPEDEVAVTQQKQLVAEIARCLNYVAEFGV